MLPARRALLRILLTTAFCLGALAICVNAIVQANKLKPHPTAGRDVERRADELLATFVPVCGLDPKPLTRTRLAAFRRSIDPMARIARRYGDLYYPSFFNETQDVKYGELFAKWAHGCPANVPGSERLRDAAKRIGVY